MTIELVILRDIHKSARWVLQEVNNNYISNNVTNNNGNNNEENNKQLVLSFTHSEIMRIGLGRVRTSFQLLQKVRIIYFCYYCT